MKNFAFSLILAASIFSLGMNLHSQVPAVKSPVDQLKALKLKNDELIQKQQAALTKLDEMEKQAEQMRFLSKRS